MSELYYSLPASQPETGDNAYCPTENSQQALAYVQDVSAIYVILKGD